MKIPEGATLLGLDGTLYFCVPVEQVRPDVGRWYQDEEDHGLPPEPDDLHRQPDVSGWDAKTRFALVLEPL